MATATPPEQFLRRNRRRRLPSTPSSGTSSRKCFTPSKQVFLQDWWLVKAELDSGDKGLGVGGLSYSEKRAIRFFLSAPVVKRCDTVTLETVDGFTVMLHGLLNRSRTLENGFNSVVCDHFEIGFPHDWKDHSSLPLDEKPDYTPNNVSDRDAFKTPFSRKTNANMEEFKKNELHSPPLNHKKSKTEQKKASGARLDDAVENSKGPLTRSRRRILGLQSCD